MIEHDNVTYFQPKMPDSFKSVAKGLFRAIEKIREKEVRDGKEEG